MKKISYCLMLLMTTSSVVAKKIVITFDGPVYEKSELDKNNLVINYIGDWTPEENNKIKVEKKQLEFEASVDATSSSSETLISMVKLKLREKGLEPKPAFAILINQDDKEYEIYNSSFSECYYKNPKSIERRCGRVTKEPRLYRYGIKDGQKITILSGLDYANPQHKAPSLKPTIQEKFGENILGLKGLHGALQPRKGKNKETLHKEDLSKLITSVKGVFETYENNPLYEDDDDLNKKIKELSELTKKWSADYDKLK